jgi:putative PEP-CTERM system histidine kinase
MNISLLAFASALFSSALAFTIFRNEKRSGVHLSFCLGMVLLALESVAVGLSWDAASIEGSRFWQSLRLAIVSFLPGTWIYFSLCYGRGNHREFLHRWKTVLAVFFIIPPLLALLLFPSLIVLVKNPKNDQIVMSLGFSGFFLTLFFLLAAVFVLMNLERTYRAAVGTMRWRIKFMILGLGILFAVRTYTASQLLLWPIIDEQAKLQLVNAGALFVGCLLILRSLFREGHFDSDVYPSHAVLQSSLTIVLAGIYLLVIGILWKVVSRFGGGAQFELKAFVVLVSIVLFTVIALSERARFYISRFVSRHFQRPLYDYRTVWRKFTEATASCVSQAELCLAAIKSTTDIFQALSVSIWLVDEKKEQLLLAGSNFLSETRAGEMNLPKNQVAEMLRHLENHREPVDIDAAIEPWTQTLRECHPEKFRSGGNRICVPMIVGEELIGFMLLGDRVGGAEFSWQDFDLLKCIGDQVAAGLLNTRLSEKLLQAKELEAFQTMSAFFVHDLKNTANTLNLMLQNLPVHFDDPAFRADALRGVGKTVTHINRLIGRLGSIRNELQIKPVESDLNELVNKSLEGWEDVAGIKLVKDFQPLPKILLDAEQFLKVATNLIFNAREAVTRDGKVHIKTSRQNGWAVLAVSDDGCGMSREFLERSLFRAFQTTKKTGLGIGMFQSKMIVEAHKGRIEVDSEPGKGSTFRVLLPLPKA